MEMTYIYALIDPRTKKIRYIGKANDPTQRLSGHINYCKNHTSHTSNWIRQLTDANLRPDIAIIECVKKNKWQERECYWIKYFRKMGCSLTNSTDGGEGCTNPSKTTRQKMREAALGKIISKETKEKLRLINTGRKVSDAARQKISDAHKGKIISDRTRLLMSLAAKGNQRCLGRRYSEETKRKISISNVGNNGRRGQSLAEGHKQRIGIGNRGKKSNLNEQDVIDIRRQAVLGVPQSLIAKKYNESRPTINRIVKYVTFKWVE